MSTVHWVVLNCNQTLIIFTRCWWLLCFWQLYFLLFLPLVHCIFPVFVLFFLSFVWCTVFPGYSIVAAVSAFLKQLVARAHTLWRHWRVYRIQQCTYSTTVNKIYFYIGVCIGKYFVGIIMRKIKILPGIILVLAKPLLVRIISTGTINTVLWIRNDLFRIRLQLFRVPDPDHVINHNKNQHTI